jgi:hypothetical protein
MACIYSSKMVCYIKINIDKLRQRQKFVITKHTQDWNWISMFSFKQTNVFKKSEVITVTKLNNKLSTEIRKLEIMQLFKMEMSSKHPSALTITA